nr:PIN domain-containing protein [Luteimonas galliterrae]
MQQLLKASREGKIAIFTSSLSVAECTHVGDPAKLEKAKPLFLQLLTSGKGGISLIQPTLSLMEDARTLRWSHGIALKGFDSVHAATAIRFRCNEFLHRDGRFTTNASTFLAMGLRVCAPSDTQLLPDEYRQGSLGIDDGSSLVINSTSTSQETK